MASDVRESEVSLMSFRSVTNVKSVELPKGFIEPKLCTEEPLDDTFADIGSGEPVRECGWDREWGGGGRIGCAIDAPRAGDVDEGDLNDELRGRARRASNWAGVRLSASRRERWRSRCNCD